MNLRSIRAKNFRSFWSEDSKPSVLLELGTGVNYIAGPNNVGKSNLLRAVALALDPTYAYNAVVDQPEAKRKDVASTVTLEFEAKWKQKGPVGTLLRYIDDYERSVPGFKPPSLANQGRIQFHVQVSATSRQELFLARGQGPKKGDQVKLDLALTKFRQVVRFVDIRSGEDLQSLLRRGFKEILGTVVTEDLEAEMQAATAARDSYLAALDKLLHPLAAHVQERIRQYVKDIEAVALAPHVATVEDAIAGATFRLKDAIETGLEDKGTGVRGATLLMLLSFVAESSRRAVVFGIEEPESFLHPEAHRALGEGLEELSQRSDVSVLVTTHSPFLFRSESPGTSRLFAIAKDAKGRSHLSSQDADIARHQLLGSKVFAEFMRRAEQVSERASLVLTVEGWTDAQYLQLAAAALSADLSAISVIGAQGALDAAFQAVTLKGLHAPERGVAALFDEDDEGKRGYGLLLSKKWQNKKDVLTYGHFVTADNVAVEAEDMFPNSCLERFLAAVGEDGHLDGKNKRPTVGTWRYSLTEAGKLALLDWLPNNAKESDWAKWKELIAKLEELAKQAAQRAAKAAAAAASEAAGAALTAKVAAPVSSAK